jgi:site-specific DNA-cytosine methylase
MKVLSLFDGMSCGRIALERANIEVEAYYASEIEINPSIVSKNNYPDIIHIGDITKISYKEGILYTENGNFNVGKIDLLIGGSPCQSISNLGDGSGLDGKSGLFWHYKRILDEVNPDFYILENVQGAKKAIESITSVMKVNPIKINSNLVSAQNRARLYWTNIKFKLPENKYLTLSDVLDEHPDTTCSLSPGRLKWLLSEKGQQSVQKKYSAVAVSYTHLRAHET